MLLQPLCDGRGNICDKLKTGKITIVHVCVCVCGGGVLSISKRKYRIGGSDLANSSHVGSR